MPFKILRININSYINRTKNLLYNLSDIKYSLELDFKSQFSYGSILA